MSVVVTVLPQVETGIEPSRALAILRLIVSGIDESIESSNGDGHKVVDSYRYIHVSNKSDAEMLQRYLRDMGVFYMKTPTGVKATLVRHTQSGLVVDRRSVFLAASVLVGMLEALCDYHSRFIDLMTYQSVLSFFPRYIGLTVNQAISLLKYQTANYLAILLHRGGEFSHETAPPPLNLPLLNGKSRIDQIGFNGPIRRFLKRLLLRATPQSTRLCFSLFQAKSSCDTVPEEFVNTAYVDHSKCLGSPANDRYDLISSGSGSQLFDDLLDELIDKTYCEGRAGGKYSLSAIRPELEISRSASFEKGRKTGGGRALLTQMLYRVCGQPGIYLHMNDDPYNGVYEWYTYEYERSEISQFMVFLTWEEVDSGQCPYTYSELQRVRAPLLEDLFRRRVNPKTRFSDLEYTDKEYEHLSPFFEAVHQTACYEPLYRGQMTARISGVCEPLKVRTVSCGRAGAYYLARSFQKFLHSGLRRVPQFALIGEPNTEESVFRSVDAFPNSSSHFMVSGDYKGATDKLNINITKRIFERILSRWADSDESVKSVLRKVLYEHQLCYPRMAAPTTAQVNGQLMGSVLSFPILCIANFLCYWISRRCSGHIEELENVPVLINGDDTLFSATIPEIRNWECLLEGFGFVKSVGKNLVHQRFFSINSALYDRTDRKYLPHFRAGLLMGRSKVQGEVDTDNPDEDIPTALVNLQSVIDGAKDKPRAIKRWFCWNKEAADRWLDQGLRNPFLPRSLGGYGLDPRGYAYSISNLQQKFAFYHVYCEMMGRTCHHTGVRRVPAACKLSLQNDHAEWRRTKASDSARYAYDICTGGVSKPSLPGSYSEAACKKLPAVSPWVKPGAEKIVFRNFPDREMSLVEDMCPPCRIMPNPTAWFQREEYRFTLNITRDQSYDYEFLGAARQLTGSFDEYYHGPDEYHGVLSGRKQAKTVEPKWLLNSSVPTEDSVAPTDCTALTIQDVQSP